jgi:sporulation protein YlmC with PRC-barrel domain
VNEYGQGRNSGRKAISSLVDMRVILPGGGTLGRVDELLVDIRSGRITYVVARCRDGSRKTIPWHLVKCQGGNLKLRDCTGEAP